MLKYIWGYFTYFSFLTAYILLMFNVLINYEQRRKL